MYAEVIKPHVWNGANYTTGDVVETRIYNTRLGAMVRQRFIRTKTETGEDITPPKAQKAQKAEERPKAQEPDDKPEEGKDPVETKAEDTSGASTARKGGEARSAR